MSYGKHLKTESEYNDAPRRAGWLFDSGTGTPGSDGPELLVAHAGLCEAEARI